MSNCNGRSVIGSAAFKGRGRTVGRPKLPIVLLQVNTTNESNKGGCAPSEIGALIERAVGGSLDVRGLMTVGPTSGDVAATGAAFRALAEWADRYGLHEKSMGMTGDYEIAVEMGATSLRLGTALFGSRR